MKEDKLFNKLLVANRGEIACRVMQTASRLKIPTVAVYSDADRRSLHVAEADEAIHIGEAPASESYLLIDRIIDACKQTGADAVHPGYGFLSERAAFAEALASEKITFVGPPPGAINDMGDKVTAKRIAQEAGVSTVPGAPGLIDDAEQAVSIARDIGYPVMIKASAGGGGKGMRVAWNDDQAREGFDRSRSEAASSFGDDRIFIEKFVTEPRHIEIQVLMDSHGNGVYLGERECSIQRRNQKIIEEAPSPFIDEATRKAMGEQSLALGRAVGYASAGTVEFIVDGDRNFYFLEMNTRLQVEHPVTELITRVDLVEQMLRVAAGQPLSFSQDDVKLEGWAIESRVYAENPYREFLPSIGRLTRYRPPAAMISGGITVRNDTGVFEGGEISLYYDPMIAKLCTHAATRSQAIDAMGDALDAFELEGIDHNVPFLAAVMAHPRFLSGQLTTAFIEDEFPDGFAGVTPDAAALKHLMATGAWLGAIRDRRRQSTSDDRLSLAGKSSERRLAVVCGNESIICHVDLENGRVVQEDGRVLDVSSDWSPGVSQALVSVDGQSRRWQVGAMVGGYRLRGGGIDSVLHVLPERVAELLPLMPDKADGSGANELRCPMPGLLVKLFVAEGETVEAGQSIAVIEAMKMENMLVAPRRATIDSIVVAEGASLAVDELILSFLPADDKTSAPSGEQGATS